MELAVDQSVIKKIPLNKPEQTPIKEDMCYNNELVQHSVQKENKPSVPPNNAPEILNVATTQFVGFRCQIPSLWKRFGAEVIDFILLCLVTLLSFFIIYIFVGIDFTMFKNILLLDNFNKNYSTVEKYIPKLFVLELSQRIVVCFYETYCLKGSTLFHGGGTIGKTLLDLTVVRADKLYYIRGQPNDNIALTPGGHLGWKCATHRSIAKNFIYSLIIPLPFLTAAANQNRCAYDVMCGTMVVEVLQPLKCDKSELIPII